MLNSKHHYTKIGREVNTQFSLFRKKHPPAKRVVLLMRAKPYVLRARVKHVSTVCQLRRIVTCRP